MITRPFGPSGVEVSVIGQGTWHMGEDRRLKNDDVAALKLGIELGMTHIDTAEMYGDGRAEEIVAEAVAGQRDRVFVATKGALDFTLSPQDLASIDAESRK